MEEAAASQGPWFSSPTFATLFVCRCVRQALLSLALGLCFPQAGALSLFGHCLPLCLFGNCLFRPFLSSQLGSVCLLMACWALLSPGAGSSSLRHRSIDLLMTSL